MGLTKLSNGILMHPVPAYKRDIPVMALAVIKEKKGGKYKGLIREIVRREGNVASPGFVDRSELYIVESNDGLSWKRKSKLKIKKFDEMVARLNKTGTEFLGLEDPDFYVDDGGRLHLYFTLPIRIQNGEGHAVYLGHAYGDDLNSLTATHPVMSPSLMDANSLKYFSGFKEISISPRGFKGGRICFVESGYFDEERRVGVSTVASANISEFGEPFELLGVKLDPPKLKYEWCMGHVSPGPIFNADYIKHGDLLVGLLNGRSPSIIEGGKESYGRFTVGLMLIDPKTGQIPWISPEPLIDDPGARTITFASDFVQQNDEEGILYAHIDDSFVRAYRISRLVLLKLLPKK